MDFDSQQAADLYEEVGWFATEILLEDDLLARALDTALHVQTRVRDLALPHTLGSFLGAPEETLRSPRPPRLNQYIGHQYQSIAALTQLPILGEIAAALSRTSEIRIFNTALVVKEPGADRPYATVGWHCDAAYWPTCASDRMLTAWIPLQDTREETGTLRVLPGSHRWAACQRGEDLTWAKGFMTRNTDEVRDRLVAAGHAFEPVPIELRRGQVSFHHMRTLHSSSPNRSDQPRCAITVHLQDGANRYLAARDATGAPASYVHDPYVRRLSNGEPDYADPEICPVIWPDGSSSPRSRRGRAVHGGPVGAR